MTSKQSNKAGKELADLLFQTKWLTVALSLFLVFFVIYQAHETISMLIDVDVLTAFYVSLVGSLSALIHLIVTLVLLDGVRNQRSCEFIAWLAFTPISMGVANCKTFVAVHGFWGFDEVDRPDRWEFLTIQWDLDVVGTLLLDCLTFVTSVYAWRTFKRLRTKEIEILLAVNRWRRHSV